MEKQALDDQMEIAKKFQEKAQEQRVEEQPSGPIELDKDHQKISFSFGGISKTLKIFNVRIETAKPVTNAFQKAAIMASKQYTVS